MDVCALILAADEDKNMRSERTRLVHDVCGRPMIAWLSQTLEEVGAQDQLYVVGYKQEQLRQVLGEDKIYVFQEEHLGTGHAVLTASNFLESRSGCVLVLPGDVPLLTARSLNSVLRYFERHKPAALLITADTRTPDAEGEVLRDEDGAVWKLLLPDDRDEGLETRMHEVYTGIYCCDTARLLSTVGQMRWNPEEGPLRMADVINAMIASGQAVLSFKIPFDEAVGVSNRVDLETVRRRMNRRICHQHMLAGVTIENPDACFIQADVKLGKDVHVASGCRLTGRTLVEARTYLGPRCHLHNAQLGENCYLAGGSFFDCVLEAGVRAGFRANFHGGVHIGRGSELMDSVELADCELGAYNQIHSHVFLSETRTGESVYIGRGVVSVDALPPADEGEKPADAVSKEYSYIGSAAKIGALSHLFKPFAVADKTEVQPGSIVKQAKRSLLPWGGKNKKISKTVGEAQPLKAGATE